MQEILQLRHIEYSYDGERPALDGVSVSIHQGEKIAVLGNNGAGKSTFFLCCNGILKPKAGEICLNGQVLGRSKKESIQLHKTVGLVFQEPDSQILAGTVEAEISFGPMNLGLDTSEVRHCVDEAIEGMNLETYRFRAPHYLSGGEKKRVSIADVLAMKPQMILFDEPAASLDPLNTSILEKKLEKLNEQGLALVIATHNVNFAWKWAERILVFHDGKIVLDASPEEVFANKELLEQCGLHQPLLYEVGEILGMDILPKTTEDIRKEYQK